ncbi:hypothetical protein U6A24_16935 [Aquimarina gracilis]|uniref:Lipoprotein n=1 Tax=Aquimarina gracilis TaxID=874422 RepID=A0ABU5ZZ77_9FLAO|nr:hypothetical protein [Aquimarina gracilis]MEB3347162.1 hypothetical protein [Aquimarina gracilis]
MKKVKIVLAFFLVAMLSCCLNDDDNTPFFYDAVAIEEVTIPDQFTRGETVEITVSYFRPSSCHSFSGFDYGGFGNERTVAVINVVIDNGTTCEDLSVTSLAQESFTFLVGQESSYVFRFWQGRDDQGNNKFLTIEVPVVEVEI